MRYWAAVVPITITTLALAALAGCEQAPDPTPTAAPTSSTSAAIDACLVGAWRELSNEQDVDLTADGGAKAILRGAGRTLTYRADGTELVDYGAGVTYRGTSQFGVVVEAKYTGTVEFQVTTVDGRMSFQPLVDQVRSEYRSNGRLLFSGSFGSPPPVSYTCTGDTMTQQEGSYRAEYRRS